MLAAGTTAAAGARVLTVGTYHGNRGRYSSIQQAVDAAHKGDWILIGPGDYHERNDLGTRPRRAATCRRSGVLVKTELHMRGMNRNRSIVDGTKPGASAVQRREEVPRTSARARAVRPLGRNGIVVCKADGVTIENLTVVQLPGRLRRAAATRSGGTAATAAARSGWARTRGAT